jgi:hypothetical protein
MLKKLGEDGIVLKEVYPEVPPKVEYSLTEDGKKLESIFLQLGKWGADPAAENGFGNIACNENFARSPSDHPLWFSKRRLSAAVFVSVETICVTAYLC